MDAVAEPPKKRYRVEEECTCDYPDGKLTRHREFFFDDGNIIIQAGLCTFCVHKSVLAKNSDVLRKAVENAESLGRCAPKREGPAFVEGCPVMYLWEEPETLAILLAALYNGCNCYIDFSKPLPLSIVCNMLSLGTKYHVEGLRVEALKRLKSYFPAELQAFHNTVALVATHDDDKSAFPLTWPITDIQLKDVFKIIGLALECDAKSLLPAAFYTAAQCPITDLVQAGSREANMTFAIMVRCLQGRETFIKESVAHFAGIQAILDGQRCSKPSCRVDLSRVPSTADVLLSAESAVAKILPTLCKSCATVVTEHWQEWRVEIWDSLGSVFSLDGLKPPEMPAYINPLYA